MEEAIRILLGSRDVSATKDQVAGYQDGNQSSSNSCFVAVRRRGTKSKAGGRDRIEEILHKVNDKKASSSSKKKKILLAMDKSLRKKLERVNLYAENSLSVSNDSVIQQTLCGHELRSANGLVRKRPYLPHPCNVYSYYYPKYDMSYGHCLYVTPWTLEVPADNTVQPARLSGMAKQVRLRSLERNWKMTGRKRRVNSARRSYTFPADAEWESTIYYFPRCDLSFCPLPFSRIRPSFGDDAKLPTETVLEEEDSFTPLDDFSCWKDLVEFEERNTEHASCLTSDRTDLDSQSDSSTVLPSKDAFSRTWKISNPHHLCALTLQTVPRVVEDAWQISSGLKMRKGDNHMLRNRSGSRTNETVSEQDTVTMAADLCATDSVWQQAEAEKNLLSAETNAEHVDAAESVSPHGDGDFDRCRLTTLCRENEKVSAEESKLTNLDKMTKVHAWKMKPKEAFQGITNHFNSRHNNKISRTHPLKDTNSSNRVSEQVSNSKSQKIEGINKHLCKSFPKDDKFRSCPQHKDNGPLASIRQFKNNLTPSEEIPKGVSPKRDLTHFDKKTRSAAAAAAAAAVPRGYERKQGDENNPVGNVNQKRSSAVWGVDLKVRDCERHEGDTSQKNILRTRNVTSRSKVPRDLGDDVLMEGSMKSGDNADLRFCDSTVPQDGLASTNNTNCKICHVNETDNTIPYEHPGGDFIPGCNSMSTLKQGQSHTFSVSAASVKETKRLHTIWEKQAHTGKPLNHGPIQVGPNFNKSSFPVMHDFNCRNEIDVRTDVRFAVYNRTEEADSHKGKISRTESLSEESHQTLFEEKRKPRLHSVHMPAKEQSIPVVGKQGTSRKCVKVERKTAMQKLVLVRSSVSGIPYKTRPEDNPRQHSNLTRDSTIDLRVPESLASDRKIVHTATKHMGNDAKAEFNSFHFGESKQFHSAPIGYKSIQNTFRPRLRIFQERPPLVARKMPKTYLSIWQNRRARFAEFLKRNPTFASISNEHYTNRSSSRLSGFSTRGPDESRRSPAHCCCLRQLKF